MDSGQRVKVQGFLSDSISINTGAPQGCVLSALLYMLYTNDCRSDNDNVQIFKYADDTAILGMIKDDDESSYRSNIDRFIKWCDDNIHNTNITKTSQTQYAVAISDDCDCRKEYSDFDSLPILEQYQAYIRYDKPFASWTQRSKPSWY